MKRLLVIGAGPIGIEAALAGLARGLDVTVLERHSVGHSLTRWGDTCFFTPIEMNISQRAREILGPDCPPEGTLLSGRQHADQVLRTLSIRPPLAGRVHEHERVVSVGRTRTIRRDLPRHPMRGERTFSILVEGPQGERVLQAEYVLDASGAQSPVSIGSGGVPAPGERGLASEIVRRLGELQRAALADRRILLMGHGHSAANAIGWLAEVAKEHPLTRVVWATRTPNRKPCVAVFEDPLPERRAVVDRANELGMTPPDFLQVMRKAHLLGLKKGTDGIQVQFSGDRSVTVDVILGFTGYRPDHSHLSELPIEISPVTEGALGIEQALSNVTDCLSVPTLKAQDLASGEPGFFMIGHKSYGRMNTFLLRDGIAQLETIVEGLG